MIRTGWDMVFLLSRIFKIVSLPLRVATETFWRLKLGVFAVLEGIADNAVDLGLLYEM